MTGLARILTVESVAPAAGLAGRTHAVLTARGGEGVDVLHLWTDDAELVDALGDGAAVELRVVPDRRTYLIRRDTAGAHEWLASAPMTGAPIDWTVCEDDAAHFHGHAIAMEDARLCAAAGHTVAVLPRG